MNEKTKKFMKDQRSEVFQGLKEAFALPVYVDEIAEDEESTLAIPYNFFIIQTGDLRPVKETRRIEQPVHVNYYSEEKDDVEEMIIDIITVISGIKGLTFAGAHLERLQAKDTDRFVDWVEVTFRRVIPIECAV